MIFGFRVFLRSPAFQGSSEAPSGCCFQKAGTSRNSEALSDGCSKNVHISMSCVI
jgi:hypothetical protein